MEAELGENGGGAEGKPQLSPNIRLGGPFKTQAEGHKAMASIKECEC
jgi:hypothetical protein